MAKPKRRRKVSAHRKSRKSNPSRRRSAHRKSNPSHRRRRRNPGMLSGASSILKSGFYALIGLVVARQVPQMVLGAKNTSWFGYGANLLVTFLAMMLGTKLLGADAGHSIGLGGGLYTVNRVIQDNFSPVGQVLSISGLGDYSALGDIQPGYFPLPVPTNASGQPIIPQEIRPIAITSARNGMSGINTSSRYASRF